MAPVNPAGPPIDPQIPDAQQTAEAKDKVDDILDPRVEPDDYDPDADRITQPLPGEPYASIETRGLAEMRIAKLAEALEDADPLESQAIMTELLRRDPDALESWLNPSYLEGKVDGQLISGEALKDISISIAAAYNNDPEVAASINDSIDTLLADHLAPINGDGGQNTSAVKAFTDLFSNAAYHPDLREFRESIATHILDTHVLGQDGSSTVNNAAGVALSLLPVDNANTESAARVLSKYATDGGDVTQLRDILQRAQISISHGESDTDRNIIAEVVNMASQAGYSYEGRLTPTERSDYNADLVRALGELHSDVEDSPELQQAVADLFKTDGAGILERLTSASADHDTNTSIDGKTKNLAEADAERLGRLWSATLFSESASDAVKNDLRTSIADFVEAQNEALNSAQTQNERDRIAGSLGFLIGSIQSIPHQNDFDVEQAEKAREEAFKLIADIVAVPLAGKLLKGGSGAFDALIEGATGLDKVALEAMKAVIDKGEDAMIEAARDAVLGKLSSGGNGSGDLVTATNEVRDTILDQVTADGADKTILDTADRVTSHYDEPGG